MIYIGCYLIAKLPSREVVVYDSCPLCGLSPNTPFCPFDGVNVPTKMIDEPIYLYEIFENVDGSGREMFFEKKNDGMSPTLFTIGKDESLILVSTYQSWAYSKHFSFATDYGVGGDFIQNIPQEDFAIDNWPLLIEALNNQKIPFTKRFGIVNLEEPLDYMAY